MAICVIGRAKWETEWRLSASGSGSGGGKAGVGSGRGSGRGIWDLTPEEVESGGMRAVLRCPVGWSGDHRIVSLKGFWTPTLSTLQLFTCSIGE